MAIINNYAHEEWIVTCITNGTWKQNCYLLRKKNFNQCLIIDPGSEGHEIIKVIKKKSLVPVGIYNTHGHYDHIGAVDLIKKTYNLNFYIHSGDKKLVKHGNLYRIIFDNTDMIGIPKIDYFLDTENISTINDWKFSIIHTPGHTEGSCCFMFNNILITGDTLLNSGPGRTDLPGGNKKKIENSIQKLKLIKEKKMVFPGHGLPFFIN
tara:strand:+ start:19054 stop:19677 length:624 start_codon:yes stop_codon:yes gene_type:complete